MIVQVDLSLLMRLRHLRDTIRYRTKLYLPRNLWSLFYKIFGKQLRDETFYEEKYCRKRITKVDSISYFIIRRRPPGAGLFSNVFHVIQGLNRAEELGAIPVVDFQHYYMSQFREGKYPKFIENSWEIFFEKVSKATLSEAYKSGSYYLSDGSFRDSKSVFCQKSPRWIFEPMNLDVAHRLIGKYIHLNQETSSQLLKTQERCGDFSKLLGVSQRGGIYVEYGLDGHARQADVETTFAKVDDFMHKNEVNSLYLQTHEFAIWEQFKKRYGQLAILPASMARFESRNDFNSYGPKSRPNHWDRVPKLQYEDNLHYLIDIYILSQSRYLITSLTNGTAFAIAKGKSSLDRNLHIFDFGSY